jgi:serine/threonine-protein kinase
LVGREIAPNSLANMAFSPDGKWLAYSSGNEVKKIPVEGGTSLMLGKVNTRPNGIAWTVGDMIVVSTWNGMWTLPATGGTSRFIAGSDSIHSIPAAVVLEDGKTIVQSVSSTTDESELRALTLSSGKSVPLGIHSATPLRVIDGTLVYVTLNGVLMAVPFDEKGLRVTGDPIQLEEGISGVGLSSSGTLAFMPGQGKSRMVLAADGKDDEVIPIDPKNYANPRFSPNGRKIAVGVIGGTTNDIWVYDIAARTFTRLTREGQNGVPEWSPDGSHVLYRSDRSGQDMGVSAQRGLWLQATDGSGSAEKLYEAVEDPVNEGLISPDGRWLIFRTSPEAAHPRDILAMPLTGEKKPQLVVGGPGSEIMPRLSPDGKWLAYEADESGRFEVYVRSFPNAGARLQVSNDGGTEPLWSRDGKTLYYHTQEGIIAVAVGASGTFSIGARHRALRIDLIPAPTHASYDVAPDGRFLVLRSSSPEMPAVVVHNWRRELREKMAKK